MSALEIRKRTHANGFKIPMHCEGGCIPANVAKGHGGKHRENSAIRVAYVAGYPAMGLCLSCSRKLKQLWDDADEGYREWEATAA